MKYSSPTNISSQWDYDSFGMLTVGRSWEVGSGYKYGFNGQEQDDEVYGNGNLNTAEFWGYDTRLGRRWNIDPIDTHYESPYLVFGCNPTSMRDSKGLHKSTHTDEDGNIIAVNNDGDNGVYQHKGIGEIALKSLEANYTSSNTSGNGEQKGETRTWDEFARIDNATGEVKTGENGEIKHVDAQIHYGQSVDGIVKTLNDEVAKAFEGLTGPAYYDALEKLAEEQKKFGRYDIKTWYTGSPTDNTPNQNDGYLLNGKYTTLRSTGNYLAGMNAATVKLKVTSAKGWYKLAAQKAGELHMKQHKLEKKPSPAYNYGEIEYTARMFYIGFTRVYSLPSRQAIYQEEKQNEK